MFTNLYRVLFLSFSIAMALPLGAAIQAPETSQTRSNNSTYFNRWRNGTRSISNNLKSLSIFALLASSQVSLNKVSAYLGNEFIINSGQATSLSPRSDGSLWIASDMAGGNGFLQLVSEDGSYIGNQIPLSAISSSNVLPSVAVFNDNSAMVGWADSKSKLISARTFNPDGTPNDTDIFVANATFSGYPLINLRTFQDSILATYKTSNNIVAQRFNKTHSLSPANLLDTGATFFSLIPGSDENLALVDATVGSSIKFSSFNSTFAKQNNAQTAEVANSILGSAVFNNDVLTIWIGQGPYYVLYGTIYDQATGSITRDMIEISLDGYFVLPGFNSNACITTFNNGNNALVIFSAQTPTTANGYQICGTILDKSGNVLISSFPISQGFSTSTAALGAVTLPNNDVFVVWYNGATVGKALTAEYLNNLINPATSSTGSNTGPTQPTDTTATSGVESFINSPEGKVSYSVAAGLVSFALGKLWFRHKATKYRETHKKFHDMVRKKLDLGYTDFAAGEGRDFCDMIDRVLGGMSDHFKAKNSKFEIADCDNEQLESIAAAFATVFSNHKMVGWSPRQLKNLFRKYKITLNAEIDRNLQSIIDDILFEIPKNVFDQIITELPSDMCVNPVRRSMGESSNFNEIILNMPNSPRGNFRSSSQLEMVPASPRAQNRPSAATTERNTPPRESDMLNDTPPRQETPPRRMSETPPPPPPPSDEEAYA